ncbi:hypothetical protein [Tsukamurella tyrosinosolvens]|uniref:hypothetical protein n=1 Tax=Tsukamurella tyrosinosolvens TaxID=57704 RepID=UPI000C7EAE71|nr:hypothetical protein [Tsukamurella tyrosinosolvens]AUN38649.1 hypothetical protein ASU32_00350 [Tsukamurella tyrosinosolvens]
MTHTTSTATYTDQAVYKLMLDIAIHDVAVTGFEFYPLVDQLATLKHCNHAVNVGASEDGSSLEWEVLTLPKRGRWKVIASGSGDEAAARRVVVDHLRQAIDSAT